MLRYGEFERVYCKLRKCSKQKAKLKYKLSFGTDLGELAVDNLHNQQQDELAEISNTNFQNNLQRDVGQTPYQLRDLFFKIKRLLLACSKRSGIGIFKRKLDDTSKNEIDEILSILYKFQPEYEDRRLHGMSDEEKCRLLNEKITELEGDVNYLFHTEDKKFIVFAQIIISILLGVLLIFLKPNDSIRETLQNQITSTTNMYTSPYPTPRVPGDVLNYYHTTDVAGTSSLNTVMCTVQFKDYLTFPGSIAFVNTGDNLESIETALDSFIDDSYVFEKIKNKFLAKSESSEKKALFILGGSGTGKSTAANRAKKIYKIDENHTYINSDDIMPLIPGYTELMYLGTMDIYNLVDIAAADKYHKIAKEFNKKLFNESIEQNMNIIFDGTGTNVGNTLAKIKQLQRNGYKVDVMFVRANLDIAEQRVISRSFSSGRFVPSDVTTFSNLGTSESIIESYGNLLKEIGINSFTIADSSEFPYRLENIEV